MYAESYVKFFTFMALSLVLGFVVMESVASGLAPMRLTGITASAVAEPQSSGSNLIFLFAGVFGGVLLAGGIAYIYSIERKRY